MLFEAAMKLVEAAMNSVEAASAVRARRALSVVLAVMPATHAHTTAIRRPYNSHTTSSGRTSCSSRFLAVSYSPK